MFSKAIEGPQRPCWHVLSARPLPFALRNINVAAFNRSLILLGQHDTGLLDSGRSLPPPDRIKQLVRLQLSPHSLETTTAHKASNLYCDVETLSVRELDYSTGRLAKVRYKSKRIDKDKSSRFV
jgi:hypothetical protein